jgi:hypothetical protein
MLTDHRHNEAALRDIESHGQLQRSTHPDEVLHDNALSTARKREILAGWASDAHAVANLPAMRQLESGAIVSVDAVLTALRALDERDHVTLQNPSATRFWGRKQLHFIPKWRRRNDDDDDPPPCPAVALPPSIELELRRRRDAEWQAALAA